MNERYFDVSDLALQGIVLRYNELALNALAQYEALIANRDAAQNELDDRFQQDGLVVDYD